MPDTNQLLDLLKQAWDSPFRYLILFLAAYLLIFLPFMTSRIKKHRQAAEAYATEHPDAARVLLGTSVGITSESMVIHRIDNDAPVLFTEKTKQGFYALPGSHIIDVEYNYTRPGVVYKNVTTSTGVTRQEIEVEAGKRYVLRFDRKAEHFVFEEQ